MTASTNNASSGASDIAAIRATGGADIPENQAPPQKMTNPKVHYMLCTAIAVIGAVAMALGIFGAYGAAYLHAVSPWLVLISLFFLLPGLVGLIRGPGVPSTHVIPRPNTRRPFASAGGGGGAAGPAPAA